MDYPTIMTDAERYMLTFWRTAEPNLGILDLADNLIRCFHVTRDTALTLACRFNNEGVQ